MKYACLCYEEESKLSAMPKSEWDALVQEVYAYNEELTAKGQLISSQALQPVKNATTVRVRNGRTITTDGPFAETKEQLGGILILEATDLNHAIQLMSKHPGVRGGSFEVRPTEDLTQMIRESSERRRSMSK